MQITTKQLMIQGKEITKVIMKNDNGMEVEVLSLGGIITKINVPDQAGKQENVVLAYKNLEDYLVNPMFFGAAIGRVAGRIHQAQLTINDDEYHFEKNDNGNTLHGGAVGFDKKVWHIAVEEGEDYVVTHLGYISEDGEEGYPGNVNIELSYKLDQDNNLELKYRAITDRTTAINLTNHTYFNLSGDAKSKVTEHLLKVDSNQVCELDEECIPTGKLLDVSEATAFDFRTSKKIGKDISLVEDTPQKGYDHPWVLAHQEEKSVVYKDVASGRIMKVKTSEPAVVIYSMNFPDPYTLSNGQEADVQDGICFETQRLPIGYNECNKEAILLHPGQEYIQATVYSFDLEVK